MSDQRETSWRLPGRYIGAAYLEALPKLVASTAAGVIYLVTPSLWPGPWILLALGPLIAVTVIEPPWRRWFTRVMVSETRITISTGLLVRRERMLAWMDLGAIDVRQSWAYRVLRVYSITLAQAGDERTKIQLWGTDEAMRSRIIALAGRDENSVATAVTVEGTAGPSVSTDTSYQGDLIYRARMSHLLLASLAYGQFALIGTGGAYVVWETLDTIGMGNVLEQSIVSTPVGSAIAIGATVVLLGFILTIVRYTGFEARRVSRGGITISYGLLSTHTRSINPDAIVGIVLQRNLIEMMLGRIRLSLLTKDSAMQMEGNLVLPSLSRAVVDRLLRTAFEGGVVASPLTRSPGGKAFLRGVLLLSVVMGGGVAAWAVSELVSLAPVVSVLIGLVVVALLWALERLLCSRLFFEPNANRVVLAVAHIVERQYNLSADAVHVVTSAGACGRRLLVGLHYYAGSARTLRSARFLPSDVDSLSERIAQGRGDASHIEL